MDILVTGSSGLIGSEAVEHFAARRSSYSRHRQQYAGRLFRPARRYAWRLERLKENVPASSIMPWTSATGRRCSIFSRPSLGDVISLRRPTVARSRQSRPFDDFDVNAVGTLNLLEAARRHCPEAPFVFMSTNKVYGDAPNELALVETPNRWDYADPGLYEGIDETMRIDQSKHSLFGASKVAADVMVQEYGRYFGMPTVCFRGGCLTGPNHSGVELHGFLNFLVKTAVCGKTFTIFGYKGKQVRDQIHSLDVVRAFEAFIAAPRVAEVYNLGGGRESNASILECFDLIEAACGRKVSWRYDEKTAKAITSATFRTWRNSAPIIPAGR